MRIGIMFHNKKRVDLAQAILLAIRKFEQTDHAQGYKPAEIRINPGDLPMHAMELAPEGLTIVPDLQVKHGHIRVCTRDMSAEEELEVERSLFGQTVLSLSSYN